MTYIVAAHIERVEFSIELATGYNQHIYFYLNYNFPARSYMKFSSSCDTSTDSWNDELHDGIDRLIALKDFLIKNTLSIKSERMVKQLRQALLESNTKSRYANLLKKKLIEIK